MKISKKIISIILSLLMIISTMPFTAINVFAAEDYGTVVETGSTGNCT